MKKYIEIFWAPAFNKSFTEENRFKTLFEAVFRSPKSLVSLLQTKRGSADYLKCPAVIDACKNIFVIEAPIDMRLVYDPTSDFLSLHGYGQDFYDQFINVRRRASKSHPLLISTLPYYLFYSHDEVTLLSQEVPIIDSEATRNTKHIVGQYDISKWVRPVNWTFEMPYGNEINIKRGDPLFAVKFLTLKDVPVKLTRVESSDELEKISAICTDVKLLIPNLKLKEAYEVVKDYLQLWRKN